MLMALDLMILLPLERIRKIQGCHSLANNATSDMLGIPGGFSLPNACNPF
jgi:hypothetical protein